MRALWSAWEDDHGPVTKENADHGDNHRGEREEGEGEASSPGEEGCAAGDGRAAGGGGAAAQAGIRRGGGHGEGRESVSGVVEGGEGVSEVGGGSAYAILHARALRGKSGRAGDGGGG